MEEDVAVVFPQRSDRQRGGGVAGIRALQDRRHLPVVALSNDLANGIQMPRDHHHDDLVNDGRLFKQCDRVFNDRSSGNLDQLFRYLQTDPRTNPTRQHDGHISGSVNARRGLARVCTHT